MHYFSVTSVVEFCDVSQQGVDFSKKVSKIIFFFIWLLQMLGTILENKVVQKFKFSKNDNNKKTFL